MQNEKAILEEMRHLQISQELGLNSAHDQLEILQKALEQKVRELMNGPSAKLMQLLYRIDINEEKARQAFVLRDADLIAKELARLILERMIQKAETRLKYRNNEIS
jgi:hypothetical protein